MLTGIAELLRVYRNQAGHPSGVVLGRDECFAHLVVFVEYLKTVYAVKGYLEEENSKRRTTSRSSGRAGAARR